MKLPLVKIYLILLAKSEGKRYTLTLKNRDVMFLNVNLINFIIKLNYINLIL